MDNQYDFVDMYIYTNGQIIYDEDMVDISTHNGLVALGGGVNYRVPLVSWQISSDEFCLRPI